MSDKIPQPRYESFNEANLIMAGRLGVVLDAYTQILRSPVDSDDPRHPAYTDSPHSAARLANVTRFESGYEAAPQATVAQPEQHIITPDKTQPLVTHQAPEVTFAFTPDMVAMQTEAADQVDELRFTPEMVAMQEDAKRKVTEALDAQENTPAYQ